MQQTQECGSRIQASPPTTRSLSGPPPRRNGTSEFFSCDPPQQGFVPDSLLAQGFPPLAPRVTQLAMAPLVCTWSSPARLPRSLLRRFFPRLFVRLATSWTSCLFDASLASLRLASRALDVRVCFVLCSSNDGNASHLFGHQSSIQSYLERERTPVRKGESFQSKGKRRSNERETDPGTEGCEGSSTAREGIFRMGWGDGREKKRIRTCGAEGGAADPATWTRGASPG